MPIRRMMLGLALTAGVALTTLAAHAADGQPFGELESVFVSPAAPTAQDAIVLHALTLCSNPFNGEPVIDGHTITLQGYFLSFFPPCAALLPPFEVRFNLPPLAPGSYTVNVIPTGSIPLGAILYSMVFQVAPANLPQPREIALAGGKFTVRILHGATVEGGVVVGGAPASAVQSSDESGYFWFFRASDMEVTVKLLDGRGVNGFFWLFAASMTNQAFVLELIDHRGACAATDAPASCTKLYANPAGINRNVIDLQAASD